MWSISYGLSIAIHDKRFEIVKLIIHTLRDNKEWYGEQEVDGVIAQAVYSVGQCYEGCILTANEALKMTKLIIDLYYNTKKGETSNV